MRTRPPSQLYRPRKTQKEKDPLGEELGDPREKLELDGIIPDTWYASSPEEIYAAELERIYGKQVGGLTDQKDQLGIVDELDVSVERVTDWEERFWDGLIGRNDIPPPPPPPEVPVVPPEVQTQEDVYEDDAFEALRANDNIDVVIERPDKDTSHQGFDYLKRAIDIYVKANTWRYEPRLWFRHPTRRNICDYVERRDHKGSGNRKGKKRGLAEQQQIKLWYLCRG